MTLVDVIYYISTGIGIFVFGIMVLATAMGES